jgi:hypothetical protein
MSMSAMAVVAIGFQQLADTLGDAESPARAKTPERARWLKSLYGGAILVHELEDGAIVDLGQSVRDVEGDELVSALRAHLGPLLDAHDDERGLFVFPEKVRGEATTIAAMIDELGELGEWLELGEAPGIGGVPPGMEAMMGQMLGNMEPAAMQGLIEQAQQMMADPAMAQQMMQAASQMMGGAEAPGGFDMNTLAEQAQGLMKEQPELVERLKNQLGDSDDET